MTLNLFNGILVLLAGIFMFAIGMIPVGVIQMIIGIAIITMDNWFEELKPVFLLMNVAFLFLGFGFFIGPLVGLLGVFFKNSY